MKDRTKELLSFLIDLNAVLSKESKNVYKVFEKHLQEPSHSFGFKLFSDLIIEIVEKIDEIFETKAYNHSYYEDFNRSSKSKIIKNIYNGENKTKELLLLVLDITKKLYKEDTKIGKTFSLLITDLVNDTAKHSFYPIDKVIKYIENKLDKEIFKELNYIEEYNSYVEEGIFYWHFFENEFGRKKLAITYKEKRYSIKTNKGFIKILNKIYKNT